LQRFSGHFLLAGAFFLAGTSVIAGRLLSGVLGVFTITAISLFFALLGLLPLCAKNLSKVLQEMCGQGWCQLALQAFFGIFLFRFLFLEGLLRTTSGEAGILTGTTPALTAMLAYLLLKEPSSKLRLLGIASTVTGVIILQDLRIPEAAIAWRHLAGNALVCCAALCESLFNILSRLGSIKRAYSQSLALDPLSQSTLVSGIALLLCAVPALTEHPLASLQSLDLSGWAALVWYGLFVTALAFVCWYYGINRCEATLAAAFSGLMPFTAMICSILLLHEQPVWQQWLGGLLVILGMLLTSLKHSTKQNESA